MKPPSENLRTLPIRPEEPPQARLSCAEFAEMYADAHPRLWALAAALVGDRNEAEDLLQEAALVALRKLNDFTPNSNFQAWMAKIVRMHALNWRRKQIARRTLPTDPTDLDEVNASNPPPRDTTAGPIEATSSTLLQDAFDDDLLRSLKRLEATPRACLLLRVVHDLSYDEIAEMLELPPGTAMSHVHRSKRRLRELISAK